MSEPAPLDEAAHGLADEAAALGVTLDHAVAQRVLRYLDAMLRENEHVNLTAIRATGAATVLHALDSLAAARAVATPPTAALDLGTGNGFPGVAVAALWPACRVVLCDRTQKKVAAVARALRAAGDAQTEAVALDVAQAQALRPDWCSAFDLVTVRAVATPKEVGALAKPLVRAGGTLLLWLDHETDAPRLHGFSAPDIVVYDLPEPAPRRRRLAAYRRIRS
ncbi:MAG: RsmG family class I SAM-dependent methyltransferase [Planctomycetota bacterium]